ncbi:hypothetical protein T484DRAFT_2541371 [Baffinella frigidus]|nr:hypothetical protein T484DRAFT_2541371 [Cryptophyta sp. CCMP2293]
MGPPRSLPPMSASAWRNTTGPAATAPRAWRAPTRTSRAQGRAQSARMGPPRSLPPMSASARRDTPGPVSTAPRALRAPTRTSRAQGCASRALLAWNLPLAAPHVPASPETQVTQSRPKVDGVVPQPPSVNLRKVCQPVHLPASRG